MSRIAKAFAKPGHKALIPYITVGYPNLETTLKVIPALTSGGADIIELGIPYSDPLADGVTIQESSYRALQNGVTPEICLNLVKKLRQKSEIPLIFMTYYNILLNFGLSSFCRECSEAGIDGLIIPDLPPEEGVDLEHATKKEKIDLVYLLSPNSSLERIKLVAEKSRGFIYLVSVTGVTGARNKVPQDLGDFSNRVRKMTSLPLCVGFGISTPEQAEQISLLADGVVVGSKLIQLIKEDESLNNLTKFVREVRAEIDSQ